LPGGSRGLGDVYKRQEMAKRRAAWTPSKPQFDSGWLQIYRRNVGPLTKGAVLVDPQ
jgi:dihydroxyacid dehydratase/phosphogluconate dehydratase